MTEEEEIIQRMRKLPKDYPKGGEENPIQRYKEEEKEKVVSFTSCEFLVLEMLGFSSLIERARETGDMDWIKKIGETKKGQTYLAIASQVCEGKISVQQLNELLRKEKKTIQKERVIEIMMEGGKLKKRREKVEEEITKKGEWLEKYPERYAMRVSGEFEEEIEKTPYMKTAVIVLEKVQCDEEQRKLLSRIFFQRYKMLLPLPEDTEDIEFMIDILNDICQLKEKQQKEFPWRIPKENKEAMYLGFQIGLNIEELSALGKRPVKEAPRKLKEWMIKPYTL